MDSSAGRRPPRCRSRRRRMAALSAPVKRVVTIVGLDTIIPCYPTLREALAA